MNDDVKLTHTSALILHTVSAGYRYGFDIMEVTGLPSGTVYPALRRLEENALIQSKWESEKEAIADQRPARRYYKLTNLGEKTLQRAVQRYPLLQQLTLGAKNKKS